MNWLSHPGNLTLNPWLKSDQRDAPGQALNRRYLLDVGNWARMEELTLFSTTGRRDRVMLRATNEHD
jgi:hypothetical protein